MFGHAEAQREAMAKEVFAYEKIMQAMKDAATAGKNGIRVTQRDAVTLTATKAATALTSKLTKAGYVCKWEDTVTKEISGKSETGAFLTHEELSIEWGRMRRHGGGQSEVVGNKS